MPKSRAAGAGSLATSYHLAVASCSCQWIRTFQSEQEARAAASTHALLHELRVRQGR